MKFYVVTPTFNSIERLRACIRSVADQVENGVSVHHHVQDGGSTDETLAWLESWQASHAATPGYTFSYASGKDEGMYDALNKAWEKLPPDAEVTAHLNSDEQYLPHALAAVKAEFEKHPKADIVQTAYMILNADNSYHCHRRPVKPHVWTSKTVCVFTTCATFHRANTFRAHGIRFNTVYRSIGDLVFYSEIMQYGVKTLEVPDLITSTFAMTGSNLAWTEATVVDEKRYRATQSRFTVATAVIRRLYVNGRRRLVNLFCSSPSGLAVYKGDSEDRCYSKIERPSCIWHIPK